MRGGASTASVFVSVIPWGSASGAAAGGGLRMSWPARLAGRTGGRGTEVVGLIRLGSLWAQTLLAAAASAARQANALRRCSGLCEGNGLVL